MSNCHNQFLKFNSLISLTSYERRKLQNSGNAIKNKIKAHFKDKKYSTPEFKTQGSFAMGTNIRPQEGYYDLDIGVYMTGLQGDSDNWPKTETIHQLIVKAVDGHTSTKPISKRSCVRVIYKSPYIDRTDISYHIDLPIYAYKSSFWSESIKPAIGFKGEKQWSEYSDPQEFIKWFDGRCSLNKSDPDQLKRIVKYLKAWKDKVPSTPKMPSGMILTVLAAKNYVPSSRDDVALVKTIEAYYELLWWSFSIKKPVEPFNDLSESMTSAEEGNFMQRTKAIINYGNYAIKTNGHKSAMDSWSKVFGKRFSQISTAPQQLL